MAGSRRKKSTEEEAADFPEWMTTYSDLVTLLLTFFVLLFSMAVIDVQKFNEIKYSLRSTFMNNSNGELFNSNLGKKLFSVKPNNSIDSDIKSKVNDDKNPLKKQAEELVKVAQELEEKSKKLEEVKRQLEEAIEKLDIKDFVKVLEDKDTVILRIDSVILFDLGKADIKEEGRSVLKKLGDYLKELDHEVAVQGHTDNLPINTLLFPTNWELSTKRATNVVLFLARNCEIEEEKFTASGNGEFRPIRPNDSEENRQKNRRIDIVIQK